jgi:hypothetical protein
MHRTADPRKRGASWRALGAALFLLVFTGPGCGGEDAWPWPEGVHPLFDETVLDEPEGVFFDFPFPSELRTDGRGHPVLSGFPAVGNLVPQVIAVIERERPGFSTGGPTYFRFSDALDPAVLPTPAASTSEDSAIWLLDIDPDSPRYGERLPFIATFYAPADTYWPGDTLAVRPVPGLGMRPGTRHAVVVRHDHLRAADGTAVVASRGFEGLKDDRETSDVQDAYSDLFAELEVLDIPREDVLVATAFTTSDPARELDRLRQDVHAQPVPVVRNPTVVGSSANQVTYEGEFDTYEYFSGVPPYTEALGEGAFEFDADGNPLHREERPVNFAITVPTTPEPVGGYPIVVYGHGTGGSQRSHTRTAPAREGELLAPEGIAMIGFEAALHGGRSADLASVESLLFSNPVAAREMVRQTVVDMMLIYRMIGAGSFDLSAEDTGGDPITFAADPVLFMGHSQGSQEAGLLLAVEPTVEAAFLSAGGGGSLIAVFDRKFEGQDIHCLVAIAAGVFDCSRFTEDHPAAYLVQALLDPADPLNFAHRFLRERLPSESAVSIYMTEGTADEHTPPRSIEALAVSIGLPRVLPVYSTSLAYELADLPSVTAPVQGNLTVPGGRTVTGGLAQWDGVDHFVIYDDPNWESYIQFFSTALSEPHPIIVER